MALAISSVFFRPFSAPSLAKFWWRWNPMLNYVLAWYVYRPTRLLLPRPLSLIMTFGLSGFLFHDVFFWNAAPRRIWSTTIWFTMMGLGVSASEGIGLRFDEWSPKARVAAHAGFLLATWLLAARMRILLGL